jgi:hypothetical protein
MSVSDIFHIHGYSIDVYVHNKYTGSYTIEQPDREHFGIAGRKTEFAKEEITLSNKKIVKEGTKIMTDCNPICGRMK